jgi:hypothetical protein
MKNSANITNDDGNQSMIPNEAHVNIHVHIHVHINDSEGNLPANKSMISEVPQLIDSALVNKTQGVIDKLKRKHEHNGECSINIFDGGSPLHARLDAQIAQQTDESTRQQLQNLDWPLYHLVNQISTLQLFNEGLD